MISQARRMHCIDVPIAGALVDPLALHLEGWIATMDSHPAVQRVEVRNPDRTVATTEEFFCREDVNRKFNLPAHTRFGFAMLGHIPELPLPITGELVFHAHFEDGSSSQFGSVPVRFIATDYRGKPYGVLLQSHATQFRNRDQIYGSGPSSDIANPGVLECLRRHLGPPPLRVLDVGCGLGSYGRHLLADGYDWFGVEIDAQDCAELTRRELPHCRVDGGPLPFPDGAFAAAICVEVLEHIAEPRAFLAEIRRVAPRLLVSVPNIELIAYLEPYRVVPWHMLEGDHKNFFTRWSLRELLHEFYSRVEVTSHGPCPLTTVEGARLDYQLLGIARA
jgi:SAM-dependent methyltransferase